MVANLVSYRLLAVDDEPLALNLIQRAFAPATDVQLHIATSPLKAIEVAQSEDLDLVLTDQRMPDMTGLALLARLREIQPRAQRILLTAHPDMDVALDQERAVDV